MTFGFHLQKFKNLHIPSLKIGNTQLDSIHDYRYLGITLDKFLTFTKHITSTIKMVSHKLYLFYLRRELTNDACLKLHKTMVLPYIEYGDNLYGCANVALLNKLQRIQNRGLKLCLNLPTETNTLEIPYKV